MSNTAPKDQNEPPLHVFVGPIHCPRTGPKKAPLDGVWASPRIRRLINLARDRDRQWLQDNPTQIAKLDLIPLAVRNGRVVAHRWAAFRIADPCAPEGWRVVWVEFGKHNPGGLPLPLSYTWPDPDQRADPVNANTTALSLLLDEAEIYRPCGTLLSQMVLPDVSKLDSEWRAEFAPMPATG